jgi:hypothetical protein
MYRFLFWKSHSSLHWIIVFHFWSQTSFWTYCFCQSVFFLTIRSHLIEASTFLAHFAEGISFRCYEFILKIQILLLSFWLSQVLNCLILLIKFWFYTWFIWVTHWFQLLPCNIICYNFDIFYWCEFSWNLLLFAKLRSG